MSASAPSPDVEAAHESTAAPNLRERTRPHASSNSRSPDELPVDLEVTKYGDASATYWKLYGSEAVINDKKFVESLRSKTESMVFLSSLFSATVGAFLIETYKILMPDTTQQILGVLSQYLSKPSTSQSPSSTNPADQSFRPSHIAIRINVVLFLSFFLGMMSAVACALIRQWCDEYMEYAYPRAAPHECGRVRTYLFQGLQQFQMKRFMYGTYVLLHISVFLFFWAISDYFYTVHEEFGNVSRYCLVASLVVYMGLSISPLISNNSPYNTPLTHPLGACGMLLRHSFSTVRRYLRSRRDPSDTSHFGSTRFNRAYSILREAESQAADLDRYALKWLFTEDDFSDRDMDKFLEGLPGYMSSHHTGGDQFDNKIAIRILERIKEHLLTCTTSTELSEEERIARVSCCIESIQLIFRGSLKSHQNQSESDKEELKQHRTYIEAIIGYLQTLYERGKKDSVVALRASCIRALAFHGLLAQIARSHADSASNRPYPMSLVPLYMLFFQRDTHGAAQQLDVSGQIGEDGNRMWKKLLSDGPLINLTILAEAIHSGEHAPPESLSFCWKTLDMLVKQLGIARTEVSNNTQRRFDFVHDRIWEYVRKQNQGFRISPLLYVLDAVARGRRLSLVFSNHPEYHGRADVMFGRKHPLHGDLLKAFACCLPDYISSIPPDERRKLMEDIVCEDDLWTSLQVNLWNTQRADLPTPDKLRILENCCAVLDVAFSSLENSTKIDWRAPEFGSLIQHFELFISHCSQNSFMGRATSFQIGIIRARCFRALLAQFCSDVDRDGTIFFRSQWDVSALARLFCTLGVGDGKDAEFWSSYINGGHVGAEFSTKARGTMDQAIRDGPLLIFYRLGRLVTMAVPLHGSGLETKDLEKVWEVQRCMIEDRRLPLSCASDKVWERLRGLRAEVNHLRGKMPTEDSLRLLLEKIDAVPPDSKELGSSKAAEERGPVTPAWLLQEQRSGVNGSSFDSEATVTGGHYGSIPISGGKDNFGETSADKAPDPGRENQAPLSSVNDDDGISFGFPSPYSTIQSVPAGVITDSMLGSASLSVSHVNSYFSYTEDTGRRHTSPNSPDFKQTRLGLTITKPSPATRAVTSPLPKLRRAISTIPSSSATGSFHGPSNLGDPGQSGAAPGPNLGVGEGEWADSVERCNECLTREFGKEGQGEGKDDKNREDQRGQSTGED